MVGLMGYQVRYSSPSQPKKDKTGYTSDVKVVDAKTESKRIERVHSELVEKVAGGQSVFGGIRL